MARGPGAADTRRGHRAPLQSYKQDSQAALCSRDMKRAVSALWARRAVRQAYFYTTTATTSSSPPEFAASASEAWDGRFRLHKPRGQHLLTNPRVLDAIARHAAINPGDVVLEVGPGTGNLTARLLASHAARVAAVEIDPRMVEAVTARAAGLGLAHKFTVRPPLARQNVSEEKLAD